MDYNAIPKEDREIAHSVFSELAEQNYRTQLENAYEVTTLLSGKQLRLLSQWLGGLPVKLSERVTHRSHPLPAACHEIAASVVRKSVGTNFLEVGTEFEQLHNHDVHLITARDEGRAIKKTPIATDILMSGTHCHAGVNKCLKQARTLVAIGVHDISPLDWVKAMHRHGAVEGVVAMILPPELDFDTPPTNDPKADPGYRMQFHKDYAIMFFPDDSSNGYRHNRETWRKWRTTTIVAGKDHNYIFEETTKVGIVSIIRVYRSFTGDTVVKPLWNPYADHYRIPYYTTIFDRLVQIRDMSATVSGARAAVHELLLSAKHFFIPRSVYHRAMAFADARTDTMFNRQFVYTFVNSISSQVKVNDTIITSELGLTHEQKQELVINIILNSAAQRYKQTKLIGMAMNMMGTQDAPNGFKNWLFEFFPFVYRLFWKEENYLENGRKMQVLMEAFSPISTETVLSINEAPDHPLPNIPVFCEYDYHPGDRGKCLEKCIALTTSEYRLDYKGLTKQQAVSQIQKEFGGLPDGLTITDDHAYLQCSAHTHCEHGRPYKLTAPIMPGGPIFSEEDETRLEHAARYIKSQQTTCNNNAVKTRAVLHAFRDLDSFVEQEHRYYNACAAPLNDHLAWNHKIVTHNLVPSLEEYREAVYRTTGTIHWAVNVACQVCVSENIPKDNVVIADLGMEAESKDLIATQTRVLENLREHPRVAIKIQRFYDHFMVSHGGTQQLMKELSAYERYDVPGQAAGEAWFFKGASQPPPYQTSKVYQDTRGTSKVEDQSAAIITSYWAPRSDNCHPHDECHKDVEMMDNGSICTYHFDKSLVGFYGLVVGETSPDCSIYNRGAIVPNLTPSRELCNEDASGGECPTVHEGDQSSINPQQLPSPYAPETPTAPPMPPQQDHEAQQEPKSDGELQSNTALVPSAPPLPQDQTESAEGAGAAAQPNALDEVSASGIAKPIPDLKWRAINQWYFLDDETYEEYPPEINDKIDQQYARGKKVLKWSEKVDGEKATFLIDPALKVEVELATGKTTPVAHVPLGSSAPRYTKADNESQSVAPESTATEETCKDPPETTVAPITETEEPNTWAQEMADYSQGIAQTLPQSQGTSEPISIITEDFGDYDIDNPQLIASLCHDSKYGCAGQVQRTPLEHVARLMGADDKLTKKEIFGFLEEQDSKEVRKACDFVVRMKYTTHSEFRQVINHNEFTAADKKPIHKIWAAAVIELRSILKAGIKTKTDECWAGTIYGTIQGHYWGVLDDYETIDFADVTWQISDSLAKKLHNQFICSIRTQDKNYKEVHDVAIDHLNTHKTKGIVRTFKMFNGVAGSGKTASVKKLLNMKEVVTVVPYSALKKGYEKDGCSAFTIAKYLNSEPAETILLDEVYAMHPGFVNYVMLTSKTVYCIGGAEQLYYNEGDNYQSKAPNIVPYLTGDIPTKKISYSVPIDITRWANVSHGYDFKTYNTKIESVVVKRGTHPVGNKGDFNMAYSTSLAVRKNGKTAASVQGCRTLVTHLFYESAVTTLSKVHGMDYVALTRHSDTIYIYLGNMTDARFHGKNIIIPPSVQEQSTPTRVVAGKPKTNVIVGGRNGVLTQVGPYELAGAHITIGETFSVRADVTSGNKMEKVENVQATVRHHEVRVTADYMAMHAAHTGYEPVGVILPYDEIEVEPEFHDSLLCVAEYQETSFARAEEILQTIAPTQALPYTENRLNNIHDLGAMRTQSLLTFSLDNKPINSGEVRNTFTTPGRCRYRHDQTGHFGRTLHCLVNRYGGQSTTRDRKVAAEQADLLFEGFMKFIDPSKIQKITDTDIELGVASQVTRIHAKQQDQSDAGTFFEGSSVVKFFLKGQQKVDLNEDGWLREDDYGNLKAGQGVSALPKHFNHLQAAYVRALEQKVEKAFASGYHLAYGKTKREMHHTIKQSENERAHYYNFDLSQQDCCKGLWTDLFFARVCETFGVPKEIYEIEIAAHTNWHISAIGLDAQLDVKDKYQSGSPWTLCSNTLMEIGVVGMSCEFTNPTGGWFQGDDATVIAEDCTATANFFPKLKFEKADIGNFCGMLINDGLALDLPRCTAKILNRSFDKQTDLDQYMVAVADWMRIYTNSDEMMRGIYLNAIYYDKTYSEMAELNGMLIAFAHGKIVDNLSRKNPNLMLTCIVSKDLY
ncbi:hypothetical protein [Beihai hepe-like virus 9]|uniref:hypothetical protein n=1 Tax=Beihai hepe-like virus 9 TaxID=1922386 RepID=UPI00090AC04D|nr:hypothetical protein [Beihai hepe-like virus 9]APG77627.1 hypothetical protein [Beihai hepe-like virus 9]